MHGALTQLHGTAFVQHDIWQHQHPPNCSEAKFLVFQTRLGIGAYIDQIGGALGLALNLDRVLILDFQETWTKGSLGGTDYCRGLQTLDNCYFEPLSTCTVEDVYGADFSAAYNREPDDAALEERRNQIHGERTQFMSLREGHYENTVPDRYKDIVNYLGAGSTEFVGGIKRDVYW